jgi:hypothetical protein
MASVRARGQEDSGSGLRVNAIDIMSSRSELGDSVIDNLELAIVDIVRAARFLELEARASAGEKKSCKLSQTLQILRFELRSIGSQPSTLTPVLYLLDEVAIGLRLTRSPGRNSTLPGPVAWTAHGLQSSKLDLTRLTRGSATVTYASRT